MASKRLVVIHVYKVHTDNQKLGFCVWGEDKIDPRFSVNFGPCATLTRAANYLNTLLSDKFYNNRDLEFRIFYTPPGGNHIHISANNCRFYSALEKADADELQQAVMEGLRNLNGVA